MANIKITDLAAYTDPVSTDVLPIVDVGNDLTKKVSIADLLENAGTGSAAAPSFSFDGDNDTGIYRPGANQVAIATGGTGRLFVDASGRVGVGTSPNSAVARLFVSETPGVTGENLIGLGDGNGVHTYLKSNGSATFGGNLGIGTSSPNNNLEVVAAADGSDAALISLRNAGGTNSSATLRFVNSTSPLGAAKAEITAIRNASAGTDLVFKRHSNIESFRIDNSGNLLIGGTTAASAEIALNANGSITAAGRGDIAGSLYVGSTASDVLAISDGTGRTEFSAEPWGSGGSSALTIAPANGTSPLYSFSNTALLIGGTLPASPNITLNADGSATFAGNVQSGGFPNTVARVRGVGISSNGYIQASNSDTAGPLFLGYKAGTQDAVIQLNNDGSASFAGGNFEVESSGAAVVTRASGAAFVARTTAGGDNNALITADGSATFAGNVGIGTTPAFSNGSGLEIQRSGISTLRIEDSSGNGAVLEIFADDGSMSAVYDSRGNASNHGHQFRVNGTEKVRLDSSGRLLVGTSSNSDVRDITKVLISHGGSGANQNVGHVISCYASNDNSSGFIDFNKSNSPTQGTHALVGSDNLGQINFRGSDGAKFVDAASIKGESEGTAGTDDMPGRLVFSTTADGASSPTERVRIQSDGRIKTFSSGAGALDMCVAGTAANLVVLSKSASSTTSQGTAVLVVRNDGDVENANNSYTALSDIKLKENIINASSQWNDLKALQVRNYNLKEETGHSTHTQIGLIAQEVELVSPGLVGESIDVNEEGTDLGTVTKSVNYSVLYMKAVKALQEAMERIETLEQRLSDAGIA